MSELTVTLLSIGFNVVIGFTMWSLKQQYLDLKERLRRNESEIALAVKKEDFKEFKEELWRKLDKIEASVESKILKT